MEKSDSLLEKRYGLPTAVGIVVGIVIGSGIFFKSEKILQCTGGNLKLGILAWLIGGIVITSCAYCFAIMATKYEKVNGLVDYSEILCGSKYAYIIGWFTTTVYYPALTIALAWLCARFTLVLINKPELTGGPDSGLCLILSGFFLIISFAINTISPKIAGKIQVSCTVIKLIPLLLMAVAGTIYGLTKGCTVENFTTVVESVPTGSAIFKAVCATAFAYDGWIIATSINSELRDSKKNLPLALMWGSLIIVFVYIAYYIGLAGGITNAEMMANGQAGAKAAFSAVFGKFGGTALFVFVIISCFGTLNGLTMGCSRCFYSLAVRNEGPAVNMMKQVDKVTKMPVNSSVASLTVCIIWLVFFYCSQLSEIGSHMGIFAFDPTELPIVTIYAFYIPIFISFIIKHKELSFFSRFIAPVFAIISSLFMIFAAVNAHIETILGYLIVFSVIIFVGFILMKPRSKKNT